MVITATTSEESKRKRRVEETKIVQRQNSAINTKESLKVSLRNSL